MPAHALKRIATLRRSASVAGVAALAIAFTACDQGSFDAARGTAEGGADSLPQFSLAWSEYPSWSIFGVADLYGLIDGEAGKIGPIEEKHGIDLVLKETDYDTGITLYASNAVDAVCITNMDILNPSMSRPGVAFLPTSTSRGADALIATVRDVKELKGVPIFGLEKSVSEYTFVRNLQLAGEDPAEYDFKNMDPAAAAAAMVTRQDSVQAIVVWNPFVMEVLKKRPDTRVVFDSSTMPGEIIDMVVMANDAMAREGGQAAAAAIAEAFYTISKRVDGADAKDEALVALGSKFSSLDAASMRKVLQQTDLYETPELGVRMLESLEIHQTMDLVTEFCKSVGLIDREPRIAFPNSTPEDADGNPAPLMNPDLTFDPSILADLVGASFDESVR